MKKLFDFRLKKTTHETKSESSKNEKGETVTVEKEVEIVKSQSVVLRKPNRSLFDEAELFYGVRLSEGIKAGLLTRALLAKRFSNDGGILSEEDKNRYADLYLKLYDIQLESDRLAAIGTKKRTKAQEEKLTSLTNELTIIKKELTDFEMSQSSLFEQTAENRARNKTILWWTLHLAYLEDEGKYTPVFSGDTYEDKLSIYDEMEEIEDEYHEELLSKLLYYVSFWYVGKVNSEEEFKQLLAETEQAEVSNNPPTEEPEKEAKKSKQAKEEKSKQAKEEKSEKTDNPPEVKETPPQQKKSAKPKPEAKAE